MYAYPLFDRNGFIEDGFINIYRRGDKYEAGYCRPHRESVYHDDKPAFRIRIKVKEVKKP
jgi:hypothetical protein